jgi:hypothetical protein
LAHIQDFHDITTASTAETLAGGLKPGGAAAWTSPFAEMLAHRGRPAHSRASAPTS